jgi:sulfite reductase (ferredoxin)
VVPDAIERLLSAYLAERRDGEHFRSFCARHTDGELRSFLAGEPAVTAVERDPSPGRPPRGVDG